MDVDPPWWYNEYLTAKLPYCVNSPNDLAENEQNIFSEDLNYNEKIKIKSRISLIPEKDIPTIKTSEYKIYPTEQQRKIMAGWIPYLHRYYNRAVSVIEEYNKWEIYSPEFENALTQTDVMRTIVKQMVSKNKVEREFNGAPADALSDYIRIFCTNLKSCQTNKKRGNISFFNLSRKKEKRIEIIPIQHKSITKNGLFPGLLGKWRKFPKLYNEMKRKGKIGDSLIIYDRKNENFYLKVAISFQKEKMCKRIKFGACDPGGKHFAVIYSPEKQVIIGKNIDVKMIELQNKIDNASSKLDNKINNKGTKLRNRGKLLSKRRRWREKIKNIRKQLHNDTANYISKNYENFYMGKLKVKGISKKEGNLNRQSKKVISNLAHCTFRTKLHQKCSFRGTKLFFVSEEFTSQSCGRCGLCSKEYDQNRFRTCAKCGFRIDRDFNGSRNIFMKCVMR